MSIQVSGIYGGGIKEKDINAELLQRLDPDFKAENIAEGVEMFGVTGAFPKGAKVITGTIALGKRTETITLSGIDFAVSQYYLSAYSPTDTDFTGRPTVCAANGYGVNTAGETVSITFTQTGDTVDITTSGTTASWAYLYSAVIQYALIGE